MSGYRVGDPRDSLGERHPGGRPIPPAEMLYRAMATMAVKNAIQRVQREVDMTVDPGPSMRDVCADNEQRGDER